MTSSGHFPYGTSPRAGAPPERRPGWVIRITPFLDYSGLYQTCNVGDPATIPPIELRILRCPSNPARADPRGSGLLHFVGIAGLGRDAPELPEGHRRAGVFGYDRATRPERIADGASQTMMLSETASGLGPWTIGGPSSIRGVDPARRPHLGVGREFGGNHSGGGNVLMADGSVRFVREAVHPSVFEAMATINGGEMVPTDSAR